MNTRKTLYFLSGLVTAGLGLLLFDRLWGRHFLFTSLKAAQVKDGQGRTLPGARLAVSSVLRCKRHKAWHLLSTLGLYLHIAWPLVRFESADGSPLPAIWESGQQLKLRLYGLGFIPFGWHNITVLRVDPERSLIQTQESGSLAPVWEHRIHLRPLSANATQYTDEVYLYAGQFTWPVALLVRFFFRYRQERWQRLSKSL